jgi:hypothetical protein
VGQAQLRLHPFFTAFLIKKLFYFISTSNFTRLNK